MELKTLYQIDSTGKTRFWLGEIEGSKYRFRSGVLGSNNIVTSGWIYAKAKNIGKINETTEEQQALLEVNSRYQSKIDSGMSENVNNSGAKFFEPMLAIKFQDLKFLSFPYYSQPKLDGIRCIANINGLWSRAGKRIVSAPHIEKALKPFFEKNPDFILDGELYNHQFKDDFNRITSLVKKEKLKEEDIIESEKFIQYHLYDNMFLSKPETKFETRIQDLLLIKKTIESNAIIIVNTVLVNSSNELDTLYSAYLEKGYEGQMIRVNDKYENKRSKFLIKRKEFLDQEFNIIDIESGKGNWAGCAKSITIELPNGDTCSCNIRGTLSYLKNILLEKQKYIGGIATVRFMNWTPDKKLRFPVVISIYKIGEDRL